MESSVLVLYADVHLAALANYTLYVELLRCCLACGQGSGVVISSGSVEGVLQRTVALGAFGRCVACILVIVGCGRSQGVLADFLKTGSTAVFGGFALQPNLNAQHGGILLQIQVCTGIRAGRQLYGSAVSIVGLVGNVRYAEVGVVCAIGGEGHVLKNGRTCILGN